MTGITAPAQRLTGAMALGIAIIGTITLRAWRQPWLGVAFGAARGLFAELDGNLPCPAGSRHQHLLPSHTVRLTNRWTLGRGVWRPLDRTNTA
ncbi:hypothetical protein A167_00799 [Alcanivorax sp. S71-1-4]|uniref:hypothetical protein n=1 Tax=Alcanivorax sp. S71-1-4 TaxID=1177159 RepID=UPI001357FBB1|nr:hypothetical protein [Alcanivorax sp. S71-1-4]KAF0810519.1 hypothetical protein A167_00799 [Alcanivorax sp. S71-1-4]